ncbi:hypothetical protein BpHYR1_042845 [Brachionus plicatilis]|uniref:Uncharacterized protein n=1 Tax=Brachionus plicatilis TaxID=10195 RepID=A0A3M7SFQ6_BRAPC|nr:hypothetical protein BpHYR1_042845 [Brachionus plicatilis]
MLFRDQVRSWRLIIFLCRVSYIKLLKSSINIKLVIFTIMCVTIDFVLIFIKFVDNPDLT